MVRSQDHIAQLLTDHGQANSPAFHSGLRLPHIVIFQYIIVCFGSLFFMYCHFLLLIDWFNFLSDFIKKYWLQYRFLFPCFGKSPVL